MTDREQRLLRERYERFKFDVSDENRDALVETVKSVSPTGYENLMKSQCAYEFHMIIEALLDP